MTHEEVYKEMIADHSHLLTELQRAVMAWEVNKYRDDVIGQLKTVNDLIEHVCKDRGVVMASLIGGTRIRKIKDTRHIIWFLLRNKVVQNHLTVQDLGAMFNKDHSTVVHGCKKMEEIMEFDQLTREDIMEYANHFGVTSTWNPKQRRLTFSRDYVIDSKVLTTV